MSSPAHRHWMVRKMDMRIFRPISEAELIQKIEAREIAPNDELCAGNGYWFMLSEVDEVRRHLGDIDLSALHVKKMGESTSVTDTHRNQKTSIISEKITLQMDDTPVPAAAVAVAPQVAQVRKEFKAIESLAELNEMKSHSSSSEEEILSARRVKNAIGVSVVFLLFIVFLILVWQGSY